MKIAMLGIRGVPAKYGGLETCAEEVGSRLVQRGHEVYCYCRKNHEDDALTEYKGIQRILLPSLHRSALDTYVHSTLACIHALKLKPDIILAFNPGIGSICIIPRMMGYPVVLNPNGFDWRRPKWGFFTQRFIYYSAYIASKVCNKLIIDAHSVSEYYREDFKCDPIHIPNGANIDTELADTEILSQYGLEKDRYFLFLSRHVPDNSCTQIIEAFEGLDTDVKLVMGGGNAEDSPYAASLRNTKDARILFPGAIYDSEHVKALHQGALAVIHGNQPGGTSLGLLKAMGFGCCVLTLNTPDNAYVVQDTALTYELSPQDLRDKLNYVLENLDVVASMRLRAQERCRAVYDWDVLAGKYEEVLMRFARKS